MIPNPYIILAGVLIVIASFGSGYYKGYSNEHEKFVAFQEQIKAIAKTQEAKNESIAKQHELVTEGVKNEYEAKLSAIHNAYAVSLQYTDPRRTDVPPVPVASARVIKIASDPEFVGRCAETTAQLVSLQDWVKKQMNVK